MASNAKQSHQNEIVRVSFGGDCFGLLAMTDELDVLILVNY